MKKLLLLALATMILANFAIATDVAYIIKNTGTADAAISSSITELNLTYSLIKDSDIASTDFSNFRLIVVDDYIANAPVNSYKSVIASRGYSSGWSSSLQVKYSGNSFLNAYKLNNSITNWETGSFKAYTAIKDSSGSSLPLYFITGKKNDTRSAVTTSETTAGLGEFVIATKNLPRRVFFGITDTRYWTDESKRLFKNSILWVIMGDDADNDGYYYDTDCNDNNANINPNATEIPYNHIDENCDGKDLADVDGDGYCKQGYLIQSRFSQCRNETGIYGTDCNDSNPNAWMTQQAYVNSDGDGYGAGMLLSLCTNGTLPSGYSNVSGDCNDSDIGVHPGADELIDNIDQNCVNDAPVFSGTISNFTWAESTSLINAVNLNDYFKDPEGDALNYSIYNTSSDKNISVDIINGVVSFSIVKYWFGNDWVIFKASDSSGLFNVSNKITLTVTPVNDPPVLQSIPDVKVVEGQDAVIFANGSDVPNEHETLSYSINSSLFSNNSNVFTWQTKEGDAGTYHFLVSISDGELADSKTVKVEVIPKIVINEFLSHDTGSEFIEFYNPRSSSVNLNGFTVEDGTRHRDNLTGTLAAKGFLAIDPSFILNDAGDIIILRYQGTEVDKVAYGDWNDGNVSDNAPAPPSKKSAGRITDGYDTDSDINDWKIFDYPTRGVSNLADRTPPVVALISPNNNTLLVNSVIFNFTASDNNATSLNCSLYSDINGGFKIVVSKNSASGTSDSFSQSNISNGNYKWNVKCSDGTNSAFAPANFTFRINAPKAPVMQKIQNITINETDTATIAVNASDSNPEDILTYSIVNAGKTNFTQDLIDNKLFTWQTGYNDSGIYNVIVSVSDSVFTVNQTVKITVLNKNQKPELNGSIPDETFNEDTTKTIDLTKYFFDPDGDNLTYKAGGNINVNIAILNGVASLVPKKDWFGVESVIFTANDSKLSVSNNNVSINVLPVNDAPVLKPIADVTVQETEQARITANASDVDSAILYYSVNDSRFLQQGNIFTWNTSYGDEGVYYVNVSASDGELIDSKTDSKIVKVTVLNKNEPPRINELENLTIYEDSGASYVNLNATDNDGTIDRFEVSQKDTSKVNCVVSDSRLAVTPAKYFNGLGTCKIRVYDNLNAYDETILNIQVTPVNDAPVINSYSPSFDPIISENGKQDFSVSWKDIDNPAADIKVEWFIDNVSSGIENSYSYTAQEKSAEIKAVVSDKENYTEHLWNLETSDIPVASSYDGETTTFSGMNDSQLQSTNLTLEKTGKGKIEFIDKVDLRDAVDFDHYSDIQTGLAALDTNYFKSLAGKIARITLYGLGFDKLPAIYYNPGFTLNRNEINTLCDNCNNVSYINGTLTFYSSFSSFKVGNTQSCSEQFGNVCSSGEICSGSWINAVENSCCLGTCSPKFSDADRCKNLSSDIELNIRKPDEGDKFNINEKIPLEIKVSNNAEDDLDFDVEIYLYDLTSDEQVYEDSKSLSVDSGKRETLNLDLTIPSDIDENDDFAIFVKADDGDYCNENFVRIDIKRERHDLRISNFDIPDYVECNSDIEAIVGVENIGKEDESVDLKFSSAALGISDSSGFNLDRHDEDKNSRNVNLILHVPDYVEEQSYTFEASAVFSGKTESLKKEVFVSCKKEQQETVKETGVIRLNSQIVKQEASKISAFDSFNDRINKMNMTDLLIIIVDIFLALGIIFIILYLLLRR